MKKSDYIILGILTLLLLFLRLSFLLSSVEQIFHWEELYGGTTAKQLIEGPILPFFAYQYVDYVGGTLFISLWILPFFLLFGQSYISLKLAHLSASLGVTILWYVFLNKYFEKRVAILSCLLLVLALPTYIQHSLSLKGHHYESTFFSAIVIFIFYEIFFKKKTQKRNFIFWGLISGFATYFAYIFLITLFVCFLWWFAFDKKFFFKRNFWIFTISFLLGFSPWFIYNLAYNFGGFYIYGQPFHQHFLDNSIVLSIDRLKNFITIVTPHSFGLDNFLALDGLILTYVYYAIFIISFCYLFWLNRKSILTFILGLLPLQRFQIDPQDVSRELFFVVYVIIFSLIYSFSNYELRVSGYETYKYIIPLYPIMFIIIALFLNKVARRGKKTAKTVFSLLVGILIFIGLISNMVLITFDNFGKDIEYARYEGFSYETLGWLIAKKRGGTLEMSVNLINKIQNKRYRRDAYLGLGKGIAENYEENLDVEGAIELIKQIADEYQPYAYLGVAYEIGHEWKTHNRFIINKVIKLINIIPEGSRSYWCKGLGWGIGVEDYGNVFWDNIKEYIILIADTDSECSCGFYHGMGIGLGEKRTALNSNKYFELISRIGDQDGFCCHEGFQQGIKARLHTIDER